MPYWIESTLIATPLFLGIYLGLGLPWALALLPRADWPQRGLLLALAFAVGPGLLTAWMFVLGLVGWLRFDLTLAGVLVLALIGLTLAWRKRAPAGAPPPRMPLAFDETLLLALILVALALRWLVIAYWPFTAYDALWVYGYQGRLYTLTEAIPASIDYYPQFLQLQYTFAQQAVGGIDDHAARAVLIFTHTGSILAAYALGARLLNRRTGLFLAAMWGLYPHVAEWSRFGDLEIPLAFLFTLAAVFLLQAWTCATQRRRYALLAGLLLGLAMWTKPTAGAFIWGVLLLLALDLLRVRGDWRAWAPRFGVAFYAGLASIPLGAAWYVRNILLGHNVIDMPPGFWLTQASRSGAEFGWPLLALTLLLGWLHLGPVPARPDYRRTLSGFALVWAALLPSISRVWAAPSAIPTHRITALEWLALAVGVALLVWGLLPYYRHQVTGEARRRVGMVGWALALALPYFVTWFYSYSYHYRLSFTIVPLLMLPSAAILAYWITPLRVSRPVRRVAWVALLIALSLPGVVLALRDANVGWDWLWVDTLPDDAARYASGNTALMWVVQGLEAYEAEHGAPPVVTAPGVDRLPFFFPLADIRVESAPTQLAELDGVTYFVDSAPEGSGAYEGIPMQRNQVIGALARASLDEGGIIRRAWWQDDGTFSYTVYELHLDRRFVDPESYHDPDVPVVFGDFVRFRGHGIGADTFWPGRPVYLQLYWEVLAPPPEDYMIYIHLRDSEGNIQAQWDGPVRDPSNPNERYYSTLVWEPGEFIRDNRLLRITEEDAVPPGDGYTIVFGLYNPITGANVPVTIDGEPAGIGYTINERLKVQAQPPAS